MVTTEIEAMQRHSKCSAAVANRFKDLSEARVKGEQNSELNVAPRLDECGKRFRKQVKASQYVVSRHTPSQHARPCTGDKSSCPASMFILLTG